MKCSEADSEEENEVVEGNLKSRRTGEEGEVETEGEVRVEKVEVGEEEDEGDEVEKED